MEEEEGRVELEEGGKYRGRWVEGMENEMRRECGVREERSSMERGR